MITLDGVMQAPGGPEEDPSNGFQYGGWVAPYSDEAFNKVVREEISSSSDYLLGRKTFEIWENYWPDHADFWPGINEGTKYVLSNTRERADWQPTEFVRSIDDIVQIKNSNGRDLQVWGSSKLIQLLLQHDLVDEIRLKIYPLILGDGKKLFNGSAIPAAFKLVESSVTPGGVIIAHYKRAGEVKTGDVEV